MTLFARTRSYTPRMLARTGARLLAATALAVSLAACVTQKGPTAGMNDMQASSAYWSERYNRNPTDKDAAFAYSRSLIAIGQKGQAVAVLQRAVLANRGNRMLQGELGKALAADGQFGEAVNVFQMAHTPDHPDWRILSAHGAVLDQMGKASEARQLYAQALRIAPGEPSVLSNLGLSYALTGELPLAERYLREASSARKADSRVRQNLALVLGLQGRFGEAETIARQEMDPAQAEHNLAVLRAMLSQPNTWANIQGKQARPGASAPASAPAPAPQANTMPSPARIQQTGNMPAQRQDIVPRQEIAPEPAASQGPRQLTRS